MSGVCNIMDQSESGGCGCKIPSSILSRILAETAASNTVKNENVIMGFESSDDCAVYDLGDKYLLFTTDFFSPIVNDPFVFGQLAASNAISDIFASGGIPLIANSILAFDPETIGSEQVAEMIRGAQSVMNKFNVAIVGGHTIKNSQPLYGFSILGEVEKHRLRKNNTAIDGDLIVSTRPLGVGILANALKSGLWSEHDISAVTMQTVTGHNSIGRMLGEYEGVSSMTDITGFGLIGHLSEMVGQGSLDAQLNLASVDYLEGVEEIAVSVTGANSGVFHNIKKYTQYVDYVVEPSLEKKFLLHDPQTNGGLLFTVSRDVFQKNSTDWLRLCPEMKVIGEMTAGNGRIRVK